MTESAEKEQLIYQKLSELSDIYKSVKHIFLLVEYYNESKGIVVSSINELRSAFDHVMRSVVKENQDGTIDEMESAKKHLYRAAYDACEVIILDRLDYIERLKSSVSYKVLNKVYPDYAKEILPFAAQLKKEVVEVRQEDDLAQRVKEYEEKINKIIEYSEKLEQRMPEAVRLKEKEDVVSVFSPTFAAVTAGSVLAIITMLAFFFPEIPEIVQAGVGLIVAVITFLLFLKQGKRGGNV